MKRALRHLVARIAIAALAFGQFATVAYACGLGPLAGIGHQAAAIAAGAQSTDVCGGQAHAPVAPPANLCTAHCQDGTIPAAAPDLPAMALAPMPLAPAAIEPLERPGADYLAHLDAPDSKPPPMLRYGRFLS